MNYILKVQDFIDRYHNSNRPIIGLDVGNKKLGVAISDTRWMIASAYQVIENKKFTLTAQQIYKIFLQNNACGLVVGLPLNMDGSYGPKAQSIKDFSVNLLNLYNDIDIAFWDERLSTVAVESTLIKADITRNKRKKIIDKLAASYILQNFLDYTDNIS